LTPGLGQALADATHLVVSVAPGEAGLIGPVRTLAADASPLVRGAAIWALSRLLPWGEFAALARPALRDETEADVRAEWVQGMDMAEKAWA
jgi:epoxyqueuosine reductase